MVINMPGTYVITVPDVTVQDVTLGNSTGELFVATALGDDLADQDRVGGRSPRPRQQGIVRHLRVEIVGIEGLVRFEPLVPGVALHVEDGVDACLSRGLPEEVLRARDWIAEGEIHPPNNLSEDSTNICARDRNIG